MEPTIPADRFLERIPKMNEQIRAFLDTDVLMRYYQGDRDIAKLFEDKALEKTRYSISPIVIQELLLGLDKSTMKQIDFDKLSHLVEIVSNEDMIDETNRSKELEFLRSTTTKLHVNDYLNLFAARRSHCDFFVTNDAELLGLHHVSALQIVTPDAFLHLEAVS
jgi:predicted nucleic acid-binding protein